MPTIQSPDLPLVSIGVPTYNRPELLEKTLTAICGQTYRNLEIIVSDNCSPGPETEQVVRAFMEKDPRIQFYRQPENKGASFNFRFVLEKATAEFFMWTSDDHEFDADHIEKNMALHLRGNYLMVISNWRHYNPNGQPIPFKPIPPDIMKYGRFVTFLRYLWLHHWAYAKGNIAYGIYRKTALLDKNFAEVDHRIGSDYAFLFRLMGEGKLGFIPEKTWGRISNYVQREEELYRGCSLQDAVYYYVNAFRTGKNDRIDAINHYTEVVHSIIREHFSGISRWVLCAANEINKPRILALFVK